MGCWQSVRVMVLSPPATDDEGLAEVAAIMGMGKGMGTGRSEGVGCSSVMPNRPPSNDCSS